MEYLIAIILISLSALFSGLTLGFFTLNTHTLKRRAELGDQEAATVYPLRRRGNLLLTTLLLGNVAVNAALSVYLGTIASGIVAGVSATALIFLFGEIIPQAVISRHALYFGSRTAPFVYLAIIVFFPVAFPIAWLLDRFLGSEMPTIYTKKELMQIVSEHEDSEHSTIDEDEERIIHGALQFSHMRANEAMTPLHDVVMFQADERLSEELYSYINEVGHSRFPVYDGDPSVVIGILFTKDLIIEDDNIAIRDTEEAFDTDIIRVQYHTNLDEVLTKMLKRRGHMAIIENGNGKCVGILTMEDIIEEIIQTEIVDEDDIETKKIAARSATASSP